MTTAKEWIESLELRRHPEGGYFRETYRSPEVLARSTLPARFGGDRAISTAIYFLLEGHDFSALHRLRQDEVWHYYDGSPVTIHTIESAGRYSAITIGRSPRDGQLPQAVVHTGTLFGATVYDPQSYALVGCTVAPGFEFADFELAVREDTCRRYPQHRSIIEKLTRQ